MWRVAAIALLFAAGCDRRVEARVEVGRNDAEVAAYEQYRQPARVVSALALAPGMRVADVGAGRGFLTTRLADAVAPRGRVVATDVDGAALGAIVRRETIETRVVAAAEPGLEAGAYDRILLADVDHYLPDRVAYFGKLARALKPGGFIAVTNRVSYRDAVVAAAAAAGLRVVDVPANLPAHFFVRLEQHE